MGRTFRASKQGGPCQQCQIAQTISPKCGLSGEFLLQLLFSNITKLIQSFPTDHPPQQLRKSQARTIGIASAIWASSIFLSSIMGLVREQIIGRTLGATCRVRKLCPLDSRSAANQ